MAELKDGQQWEMEGKKQCHSCLTLMTQVLVRCWNQTFVRIFENSQLEDLGDFQYNCPSNSGGLLM